MTDDSIDHLFEPEHSHDGPCLTPREVFGFDPRDHDQYQSAVDQTLEMFFAYLDDDLLKAQTEGHKVFAKGPEAIFISLTTLCATAQNALIKAFGEDLEEGAKWQMEGIEGIPDDADPDFVDAQFFAAEFMMAFLNEDPQGALALYTTILAKPVPAVSRVHSVMLAQTKHIFAMCVEKNPGAFEDSGVEGE